MPDNAALCRQFYEGVSEGRLEIIDELCTEDFVDHEEFPGLTPDREGVKQFFGMMRGAFPDLRFNVEDTVSEDDKVAIRLRITGTHEGDFMGIAATHRGIEIEGIDIVTIVDGRATEHWGVTDMMAMMQQLGVIEAPEGATA